MTMPDQYFPDHDPPADDAHHDTARRDDTALIARVRASDEEAFAELVRLYIRPMVRFAYTLVHSWETAEDVVQTVFIQFWEGRATHEAPRNLQAYLFSLVRNRGLDERRRLAVRARHRDEVQSHIGSDLSPTMVASPEDQVLDRATVEAVVWRLSDQRRHALRLRYVDQLSFEEIGDVLAISAEAARKLVFRALQDLRDILGVSG